MFCEKLQWFGKMRSFFSPSEQSHGSLAGSARRFRELEVM